MFSFFDIFVLSDGEIIELLLVVVARMKINRKSEMRLVWWWEELSCKTINSLPCIHHVRKLDLVKLDQFRVSPAVLTQLSSTHSAHIRASYCSQSHVRAECDDKLAMFENHGDERIEIINIYNKNQAQI